MFIAVASLVACESGAVAPQAAVRSDPPPQARANAPVNAQIVQALQARRYADALDLIQTSPVAQAERDFAAGEVILQGATDSLAAQRPAQSLEQGLALMEEAALAGHAQALSGLAATFHTGVRQDGTGAWIIPANEALSDCWRNAKAHQLPPKTCVDMRRSDRRQP